MVKLEVRVDKRYLQDLIIYFKDIPNVRYYLSSKFFDYRHNFNIVEEWGSFWFGFQHNMEVIALNKHKLVVEFNPNKFNWSKDTYLYFILQKYFRNFSDVLLKSFDVSIDLPCNIMDLYIDNNKKRLYKLFSFGGDDLTHYFGKGNGRVKIYNKAKESGLDFDLTRYEISYTIKDKLFYFYRFNEPVENLPNVFFLPNFDNYDIKDKILMYAFKGGLTIQELKSKSRKIYERCVSLFNSQEQLYIDSDKIDISFNLFQDKLYDFISAFFGEGISSRYIYGFGCHSDAEFMYATKLINVIKKYIVKKDIDNIL